MDDPGFKSVFRDKFCELITLKQSLGFKYEAEAVAFRRIDTFFCQHQLTEKRLSKELCDHWCQKRSYESAANHAHRISSLRVFCKYLSSVGIPAYIPPHGLTSIRKNMTHTSTLRTNWNAFLLRSMTADLYLPSAPTGPLLCRCFSGSFIQVG